MHSRNKTEDLYEPETMGYMYDMEDTEKPTMHSTPVKNSETVPETQDTYNLFDSILGLKKEKAKDNPESEIVDQSPRKKKSPVKRRYNKAEQAALRKFFD